MEQKPHNCVTSQYKIVVLGIPVSMSVTARQQIRLLYGLFNIDLFIKITRHKGKLPKKDRLAINPKEVFMSVL